MSSHRYASTRPITKSQADLWGYPTQIFAEELLFEFCRRSGILPTHHYRNSQCDNLPHIFQSPEDVG